MTKMKSFKSENQLIGMHLRPLQYRIKKVPRCPSIKSIGTKLSQNKYWIVQKMYRNGKYWVGKLPISPGTFWTDAYGWMFFYASMEHLTVAACFVICDHIFAMIHMLHDTVNDPSVVCYFVYYILFNVLIKKLQNELRSIHDKFSMYIYIWNEKNSCMHKWNWIIHTHSWNNACLFACGLLSINPLYPYIHYYINGNASYLITRLVSIS